MSRPLHVLVVAGPDADTPYLRELAHHLDPTWFRLDGVWVGPGSAPVDGFVPVPPSAFRPWEVRRAIRRRAAEVDLVDGHGFTGFWAAMRSGLWTLPSVYTRTTVPESRAARQREAWVMGQADAVVAVRPEAAPAGRRAWVPGDGGAGPLLPPRGEARRQLGLGDDARLVVVLGDDAPSDVERAVRKGAASARVARVPAASAARDEAGRRALAAADVVVVAGRTAGIATLRAAFAAGAATLLPREPSVAGQVRCLRDAWLLDPAEPDLWYEAVRAVLGDPEIRAALAAGAAAWQAGQSTVGRVREIQGIYAGVVAGRTGRCPVCPAASTADVPSGPGERRRETTRFRE